MTTSYANTESKGTSTSAQGSATESHPRPSLAEALERGKMRKAEDDRTQRIAWIAFFAVLALLLVMGVAFGLAQRG